MAQITATHPIKMLESSQQSVGGAVTSSGYTGSTYMSLRRRDLYIFADAWGVDYPPAAPATQMRILLEKAGINPKEPPPKPYADRPKEFPKVVKITEEMQEAESIPLEDTPVDYTEWKFLDLRKECKRKGIKFVMTDKKHDLLEKLKPAEVIYGQIAT